MSSLAELQELILRGDKKKGSEFVIERVLPNNISDDGYGTLIAGMKSGVINPNEVLIEGVEETIERGGEFFQIAGLALRMGADPNTYVKVRLADGSINLIHILYYAWIITPKTNLEMREEIENLTTIGAIGELSITQNYMIDVMCLLITAGSDYRRHITDANLLLTARREMEGASKVSQADVLNEVGTPSSVWFAINRDPTNPELSRDVLEKMLEFDEKKTQLSGDAEYRVIDGTIVNNLEMDIIQLLDLDSQIGPDPDLFLQCLNVHANKCVRKIIMSEKVEAPLADVGFIEAIDSYNGDGALMLIQSGYKPPYNYLDRLILRAREKTGRGILGEDNLLSARVLNTMLVELSKRGVGFDDEQMKLIGSYSEKTMLRMKKIQQTPYWKRTCSVPGNYVRNDLRQLARELNLPADAEKQDICMEFERIDSVSRETALKSVTKLQHERLQARRSTLGGIVAKRSVGKELNTHDPVCVNAEWLSRNEDTYADVDLVMINEGGKTYCFEAIDYPRLLETSKNPVTQTALTTQSIEEVEGKYRTLMQTDMPLESQGVWEGIKRVKNKSQRDRYDEFVKGQTEKFLDYISDAGIDRRNFTYTPMNGGLLNEQIMLAARELSGEDVVFNLSSREATVRGIAMTFFEIDRLTESQEEKSNLIENLRDIIQSFSGDE